jgi:hypothetical protein
VLVSSKASSLLKRRMEVMTEPVIESNENREEVLTYDISDEALDRAVGDIVAGNYTLGACTGLAVCPG